MLIDSSVLQVAGEIGKVNGISRVLFANSDGYKGFMPGKVYITYKTKVFNCGISCLVLKLCGFIYLSTILINFASIYLTCRGHCSTYFENPRTVQIFTYYWLLIGNDKSEYFLASVTL